MSNLSPKPKSRTAVQRRKKVKLESKKHKLGKKKVRHAANHDNINIEEILAQLKPLTTALQNMSADEVVINREIDDVINVTPSNRISVRYPSDNQLKRGMWGNGELVDAELIEVDKYIWKMATL